MHRLGALVVAIVMLAATDSRAQLDQTVSDVFNQILIDDFQLSPGPHRNHFIPAAAVASEVLTPALNRLIASNVASFPLSSTVAGISFDFSTGQPVRTTESLGPIFAETSTTLGPGNLVVGMNATSLSLTRFRGMPVDELRFSFTHEDTGEPGLGDDPNELDVVHVYPRLSVDAQIVALSATYGVFDDLDVGIAVPLVRVSLSGEADAIIDSRTLFIQSPFGGGATHFFGGDAHAPVLQETVSYEASSIGLGDVALRAKYRFPLQTTWGAAALLDIRLPTGSERDFRGTGSLTSRMLLIASRPMGSFAPHLNVGYEFRGSDFDSDEVELVFGFDQQLGSSVTFALDLLGEFDLSSDEAIRLYGRGLAPTIPITDRSPDTGGVAQRAVAISNVPDRTHDHVVNLSVGARLAPTPNVQFLVNLIVPLQDGGLRPTVAPTIGGLVTL